MEVADDRHRRCDVDDVGLVDEQVLEAGADALDARLGRRHAGGAVLQPLVERRTHGAVVVAWRKSTGPGAREAARARASASVGDEPEAASE